ncbi:hypothetical protein OIDMADRAFT_149627 [Oidiodendron maius Zn]|uniref:Heterokaryon incompatibility domain-containing protein n=1 Tax=Oidiodendron maius (strain Zn) TaxID=913774 RepID=A0A0C3CWB2_OIDMZ|nr:hypothetical protein OIDMADRAFT_149627 [Oidiodendron maius Zn]
MTSFRYSPLDFARSEIRLLRLFPSTDFDAEIRLELFHASIQDPPKYFPLSYTWGAPHEGLSSDWDDVTHTNTIKEIAAYRGARKNREQAGMGNTTEVQKWYVETEIGHDAESWSAISHIFLRFWWQRAWIFQEAIVSPDAMVLCGSSFAFWDAIMQTHSLLHEALNEEDKKPEGHMAGVVERTAVITIHASIVTSFWKSYRDPNEGANHLKEILSILRGSQASDPRDKVYAALGVSGEEALMAPNYSLSVQDVYVQLARTYIERYQNLDLLGYCRGPQESPDLPSWVPDWRLRNHGTPFYKKSHFNNNNGHAYTASKIEELQFSFSDDRRKLRLKGCIVSTIEILGEHIRGVDSNLTKAINEFADQRWKTIHQWKDIVNAYGKALFQVPSYHIPSPANELVQVKYPFSNDSLARAFQKTLFADIRLNAQGFYTSRLSNATDANDLVDRSHIPDPSDGRNSYPLTIATVSRTFFVSRQGYIGLVPEISKEGDIICVFAGADVPHVIREAGDRSYTFVGECYVHGLMNGEAMDLVRDEKLEMKDIILR